jgi:hypothetical protein
MPLYITLILHTIISWMILTVLLYRKTVPNLFALFSENLNFGWPGALYYGLLFAVERFAQAIINYAAQVVLHLSVGLPYLHLLPAPWYWLMPLSFFLILPLCGWTRFYHLTWHQCTAKSLSNL